MKINTGKTKIMPFNFTRKFDFLPRYTLNGEKLEPVHCTRLLGVIVSSDGKFSENTKHIVRRASSKLWFLRRLKSLGASADSLLDLYRLFVRSRLELASPVWASALTKGQSKAIERVQKNALSIIQGNSGMPYEMKLKYLKEMTLAQRREKISLKFAKKCLKNEQFSHLFPRREGMITRSKTEFVEPKCKTQRYRTSCIPSLIRMLNTKK